MVSVTLIMNDKNGIGISEDNTNPNIYIQKKKARLKRDIKSALLYLTVDEIQDIFRLVIKESKTSEN